MWTSTEAHGRAGGSCPAQPAGCPRRAAPVRKWRALRAPTHVAILTPDTWAWLWVLHLGDPQNAVPKGSDVSLTLWGHANTQLLRRKPQGEGPVCWKLWALWLKTLFRTAGVFSVQIACFLNLNTKQAHQYNCLRQTCVVSCLPSPVILSWLNLVEEAGCMRTDCRGKAGF